MNGRNATLKTCKALLLGAAVALTGAAPTTALASDPVALEFGGRKATEVRLPIGRSQIISSPVALEQVVIGSPEVADIKLLSAGRVLVLGIKPGRTNLVFRQKGGDLVALMDVVVGYDLNGVKQKIFDAMPGEKLVEVRDSNDRVILAGQVSSAQAMDMALNIARSFVPADKVVNLMQVGGGQQVMLEARISEVSRNSLKELGVKTDITDAGGQFAMITSGAIASAPFGDITWTPTDGAGFDALTLQIKALEEKGLAKTLAEPNLVALSGQEANFLAGGEIPIPVAQNVDTITVEYKEYGIGLRFTPTVLAEDKINLRLLSEVSSIDASNSVTTGGGIQVPAITTRRAGTTVELADGQSFAIAGLLESNDRNKISQVPLLGSIPVLGALFRSTGYQRGETELVIVVTAHLVKPQPAGQLALPTDTYTPASDLDQYLLGRLEGSSKERRYPDAAGKGLPAGGLESGFGHQQPAASKGEAQ